MQYIYLNFSTSEISLGEKSHRKWGYAVWLWKNLFPIQSLFPHLNVSPSPQHPSGYGTYPSATHQAAGHHCATSSLPRSAPGTLGWPRSGGANATSSSPSSSSSSQQIQQRISVPPNSSQGNLKNNLAARRKAAFLPSVVKRFRPHHNTQNMSQGGLTFQNDISAC